MTLLKVALSEQIHVEILSPERVFEKSSILRQIPLTLLLEEEIACNISLLERGLRRTISPKQAQEIN